VLKIRKEKAQVQEQVQKSRFYWNTDERNWL